MKRTINKCIVAYIAILLLVYSFPINALSITTAWDGSIASSFDGGAGTVESPYLIKTAAQLAYLAQTCNEGNSYSNYYFKLTSDIVLNPKEAFFYDEISNTLKVTEGATPYEWVPIGKDDSACFSGSFDGCSYRIIGLYIDTEEDYQGLFGYCKDSIIQNLEVIDGFVNGHQYIGGVVGYMVAENKSTIVSNCINRCIISGNYIMGGVIGYNFADSYSASIINCSNWNMITGKQSVGGVVGTSFADNAGQATVKSCYNTSVVNGSISLLGGVVGSNKAYNSSQAQVLDCYNIANITDSCTFSGQVGGVVGQNYASSSSSSTVSRCYNTGEIKSAYSSVGGIVGYNWANDMGTVSVSNCYNTGVIVGSQNNVGGLVGVNYNSSAGSASVLNGYNIGTVRGRNLVGGVVGQDLSKNGGRHIVNGCYYKDTCIEKGNSCGKSLTDAQMRIVSNFKTFDFLEVWTMDGSFDYPYPELAGNNQEGAISVCTHKAETIVLNERFATCCEFGYSGDICCSNCYKIIESGEKTSKSEHLPDVKVVENEVAPTCENDGSYEDVEYCLVCGEELSRKRITIPANGHNYATIWTIDTEPTCMEEGAKSHHCLNCESETDITAIPALGHDWGTVTYEWSADNSKCSATRVCSRDASHIETETVNSRCVTTEADYYNNGNTVYTATFENSDFTTQTKTIEIPMLVWKGYPDVHEGDWYYESVKYCSVKGFITGYGNGNFGPADALQRQDFVVILARIAGADIDGYTSCKLTDVDMNAYYGKAVAWAVDQKIIGGYDNGKFGVGDKITREQVATILYRYMDSPDIDTGVLNKFPDKGSISAFAVNAIAWANTNGIINGKSDGTLAPVATASRAEIATIIMRMDQQGMFNE